MKKQITKSYLEYLGITDVTADGRVFTKNGELKPHVTSHGNRLAIKLHDPDKYKAVPKEKRTASSGQVRILVHHVVYAWFNSEVPYGKEIHHIDHNYLNNAVDNLEALTREEHRAKHRKLQSARVKTFTSLKELKCRLDIPREWYETKLEKLEELPESDSKRAAVYQMRCKLRYYDAHINEANQLNTLKKDLMVLKYWKRIFKDHGNKKLWRECCTIEKMVKEKGIEAMPAVKHALDVIHNTFGGK